MDDELKAQIEMDAAKGETYQRAWDNIIKPFIDAKQAELYQAFVDSDVNDKERMLTIKLQSNAMESLENEMKHYINTGKLARKAIEEDEKNEH